MGSDAGSHLESHGGSLGGLGLPATPQYVVKPARWGWRQDGPSEQPRDTPLSHLWRYRGSLDAKALQIDHC